MELRHRRMRPPKVASLLVLIVVAVGAYALISFSCYAFVPPHHRVPVIDRRVGAAVGLASLPVLPAWAEEPGSADSQGRVGFNLMAGDTLAVPVMEGAEKSNEKWAFTVRAFIDCLLAGDFEQAKFIVSDYIVDGWEWFVERVTIGDPPWEEIGQVALTVVILGNLAQFFIVILDPLMSASNQTPQAPSAEALGGAPSEAVARAKARLEAAQGRTSPNSDWSNPRRVQKGSLRLPPRPGEKPYPVEEVSEEQLKKERERPRVPLTSNLSVEERLARSQEAFKKPVAANEQEREPVAANEQEYARGAPAAQSDKEIEQEVEEAKQRADDFKDFGDRMPKANKSDF